MAFWLLCESDRASPLTSTSPTLSFPLPFGSWYTLICVTLMRGIHDPPMCPSLPRLTTFGDDRQCPSSVSTRATCPGGDGVSKWISRLSSLIDMWGDRPCPLQPNKETYTLVIDRLVSPLTPQHRYIALTPYLLLFCRRAPHHKAD
jgi:hypothetical protein